MRRKVLGLLAGLIVFHTLLIPGIASAHSNLLRTDPLSRSILGKSPDRIVIWFTAPLEPGFSEIKVFDKQGNRVDNGDSKVGSPDSTVLSATVPPLPVGTYIVAWKNTSIIDGHSVRGSFVFAIGEAPSPISLPGIPTQIPLEYPAEPLFRWLVLIGILAIAGALSFELFVYKPALTEISPEKAVHLPAGQISSGMHKFTLLGMGIFLAASTGQLISQTAQAHDLSLGRAISFPLISSLLSSSWGNLWLWRMASFVAMVIVFAVHLGLSSRKAQETGFLAQLFHVLSLLAGIGVLFTISLSSHSSSLSPVRMPAVFSDFLHLLAAGFWVGGLFTFTLVSPAVLGKEKPDGSTFMLELARKFSIIAYLGIGTLIITGLYSAWSQITVTRALETRYGFILLTKIGVFISLLSLPAANFLWVRPHPGVKEMTARWQQVLAGSEAAFAILILFLVGLLTTLEPARQVVSRMKTVESSKSTFNRTADSINVGLSMEPGKLGPNLFIIQLTDRSGQPIRDASSVIFELSSFIGDPRATQESTIDHGEGFWIAHEGVLNSAGAWRAEIIVKRPGLFDARVDFRFDISSEGVITGTIIAPSRQAGFFLWSIELILLALLFISGSVFLLGWRSRAGLTLEAGGVLAFIAALLLMANTFL